MQMEDYCPMGEMGLDIPTGKTPPKKMIGCRLLDFLLQFDVEKFCLEIVDAIRYKNYPWQCKDILLRGVQEVRRVPE